MLDRIREDIDSILQRDPAARSALEVFLCSPGLHAVWAHRVHHWLWLRGWRLTARILSQITRFWTGVEIHPGAVIGRRLFIDHGMGVVIGETAVVGNDVTLYQGVTLGGTGSTKASAKVSTKSGTGKRHPTLCDCVFVGNNANVLGDITIGANSRVGAGSVVLRDVPPNSTVVGVPAHIIYRNGQRVLITDPHEVKDPLSDALIALAERVDKLETKVGPAQPSLHNFYAEDEEREAYRQEVEQTRDYVSMGEGI
jgi:serine O-acetyltransferase